MPVLLRVNAQVTVKNRRRVSGEVVGRLHIRYAKLKAVTTEAHEASSLIDEFPALFVMAAAATGVSVFKGLAELRFKESDRLSAMAEALQLNGVEVEVIGDSLKIKGSGKNVPGGALVASPFDHRVAMALALLGLIAEKPIEVSGAETLATSFPGFVKVLRALGANLKERP